MGGQHGAAQPGDNEHTTELPDHSRTSRAGATLTVTVEGPASASQPDANQKPSSLPQGGRAPGRGGLALGHLWLQGRWRPSSVGEEQTSHPPGHCSQVGPQTPAGQASQSCRHSVSPGENFRAERQSPRSAPRPQDRQWVWTSRSGEA